jgi:hypothetical protein
VRLASCGRRTRARSGACAKHVGNCRITEKHCEISDELPSLSIDIQERGRGVVQLRSLPPFWHPISVPRLLSLSERSTVAGVGSAVSSTPEQHSSQEGVKPRADLVPERTRQRCHRRLTDTSAAPSSYSLCPVHCDKRLATCSLARFPHRLPSSRAQWVWCSLCALFSVRKVTLSQIAGFALAALCLQCCSLAFTQKTAIRNSPDATCVHAQFTSLRSILTQTPCFSI